MTATHELKLEMYRRMLRIRQLDESAVDLIGKGEIPGGTHTCTNQEAVVVGATLAVRSDDYMTGTHRSHGHPIGKGSPLGPLMAELMGKRTGVCKGKGGSMHLTDFGVGSLGESGIVAAGLPIAVGAGLSVQTRGTDQVVLAFFGDGAANAGPTHEAMNLASIWRLPVIFVCENNGWAVTTQTESVTSVKDIAERGAAYSMPSRVVDGQDPVAVHEVVHDAVEAARRGGGPYLVEAKTYRTTEHSMGMPVLDYRDQAEIDEWIERDPIVLLRDRLIAEGVISAAGLDAIVAEVSEEVKGAIVFARNSDFPDPQELLEDMYAVENRPASGSTR